MTEEEKGIYKAAAKEAQLQKQLFVAQQVIDQGIAMKTKANTDMVKFKADFPKAEKKYHAWMAAQKKKIEHQEKILTLERLVGAFQSELDKQRKASEDKFQEWIKSTLE